MSMHSTKILLLLLLLWQLPCWVDDRPVLVCLSQNVSLWEGLFIFAFSSCSLNWRTAENLYFFGCGLKECPQIVLWGFPCTKSEVLYKLTAGGCVRGMTGSKVVTQKISEHAKISLCNFSLNRSEEWKKIKHRFTYHHRQSNFNSSFSFQQKFPQNHEMIMF